MEITDEMPERMRAALTEIKKMPETATDYRAAIVDWVQPGPDSPYAMSPDEVIAGSPTSCRPRRAAACFELGTSPPGRRRPARIPWWKQAHSLFPENWTYKRQAWTLESTPEGEPSDLSPEVAEVYGTSWLDDVLALGGGAHYGTAPQL